MADPFTLAITAGVGAAASAGGGILSAFGQKGKAEAEAQQYQVKSAIAKRNAAIQRQNALWTRQSTEQNAEREGLTTAFTIGKQKTAQAAGGFDVNTGSYADVRESTQKIGQRNVDLMRTEGRRKAIGYEQGAELSEIEGVMDIQASQNAKKAGDLAFWSTLVGTAGSVADKWSKASYSFGR